MGRILKLDERLSKLRAMSAREVGARIRYLFALRHERRQYERDALVSPERLPRALRSDLRSADWRQALVAARRSTRARFLAGAHDRQRMRDLFETTYRSEREATFEQAARARDHRFEFFGREFSYGAEIEWQADPVTGRSWPSGYHADVPVHSGDVGYGDVKYVWELNRQQYVIDLAKSWCLAGRHDDLQAIRRLVRSWIAGNPYATGVNWSCALEPAFRTWSWLWAYHLTAEALDDEFHVEWLQSFYDHARFLATHLEHYSSPYNHLIGEASALYALGVCFPEFQDAAAWARLGRSVLERRLGEQFYDDGGSVEQSTFYHHATAGFYLLAGLVARQNAQSLDPSIRAATEKALAFSMTLMQPDGSTPEIGGADDGKPIRMEHLPFWDFRPYLAIGAVAFERPDFKVTAGRFYEDALWLLGPDGYDHFAALPGVPPHRTEALLAASGYIVSRSEWTEKADYVCFDVGEQAAGMRPDAIPNSMHGHADCLSVIVWLGGRRVLVDSGLFAYNCGGEWEAHFRETAAHNTVRIDGRDQARHIGKMAWSHSYRATIEDRMADPRQSWTIGSHDGYARGPHGVTHRRLMWRRPGGYVLIYDEFIGDGEHDLEVVYQFAPGALKAAASDRVVFEEWAEVTWAGSGTWTSRMDCGGPHPDEGWICRSLGVRQPAPRLVLKSRMTRSPAWVLTVLADCSQRTRQVRFVRAEGSGQLLAAIQDVTGTDWVAPASAAGPISSDATLVVCAVTPGGAEVERTQVRGTQVRIDTAALMPLMARLDAVVSR